MSRPYLDVLAFKQHLQSLIKDVSTEVTTLDEGILDTLPQMLPPAASIYVAHVPKASVSDVVRVSLKLEALGFHAVPHLAARCIPGLPSLRATLEQLSEGGVRRALLIAGDRRDPVGPFADTLQLLDSGLLAEHDFQTLGIAGHPESHPEAPPGKLWHALLRKQAYANATGTAMHIVTQFSFDAEAIFDWESQLIDHGISLPVHVGIAGPTPMHKLLKFAMLCGVGASKGALRKGLSVLSSAAGTAPTADQVLFDVVRRHFERDHTLIQRLHVYALGGIGATARWIRALHAGEFDFIENHERLLIHA